MTDPNEPTSPFHICTSANCPGPLGLTKREYFAAMAMQAVISGRFLEGFMMTIKDPAELPIGVSKAALEFADALIAELNK